MSRVRIFETDWLNLVFEGKNKEYGAYQLRREHPRTTFLAFLLGLLFVSVFAIVMLLSPSRSIAAPLTDDGLYGTKLVLRNIKPNIPAKRTAAQPEKKQRSKDDVKSKDLKHPVLVDAANADEIKNNTDTKTSTPTAGENGTGTTVDPAGTGSAAVATGIAEAKVPETEPDAIEATYKLDKMPEYPGGIKKFYQYIANNFEKPELDETVSVLMAFVIEKDGSMTDIKVLRSPGHGLDKEAIRVLKSLRTKWEPGMKNGKAVRTQYTLPIKVTRYN